MEQEQTRKAPRRRGRVVLVLLVPILLFGILFVADGRRPPPSDGLPFLTGLQPVVDGGGEEGRDMVGDLVISMQIISDEGPPGRCRVQKFRVPKTYKETLAAIQRIPAAKEEHIEVLDPMLKIWNLPDNKTLRLTASDIPNEAIVEVRQDHRENGIRILFRKARAVYRHWTHQDQVQTDIYFTRTN